MIDFSDLIGKPFDPDGYGPDRYSCYGLAVEVFRRYGIDIPRTNISVCACRETSQQEIEAHKEMYWAQVRDFQPFHSTAPVGLLIRSGNPDFADHIATFIGQGQMIHITVNRSVVVDRVSNWKHKILGAYKYVNHTD